MSRNILEPEPYVFDSDFEALVVALACNRSGFWAKVGRELEVESMPTEEAKMVLREAKQLAKETGAAPIGEVVRQRLTRRSYEGKFPASVLKKCTRLAELRITPSPELETNVLAELIPLIKQRLGQTALFSAADEFAKGKGFEKTKSVIARAEQVGEEVAVEKTDEGIDLLGEAGYAFDEIALLKTLDRMPTGIPPLDVMLGGGFWRGCCAMFMASTGDGKSMTLGHLACTAVRAGVSVAIASLEDDRPLYNARLTANLTGWEWEEVMRNPAGAKDDLRKLRYKSKLRVRYFDPDATRFDEIVTWAEKEPFELLIIDYCDKVAPAKKTDSSYLHGRDVVQDMRKYAGREKKWLATASQAKRRMDRKRLLENDDVSESMHKVRIPQLVITLNYDKTSDEVTYVVSKNRMGRGRFEVGPEPHDWARARAVPLV